MFDSLALRRLSSGRSGLASTRGRLRQALTICPASVLVVLKKELDQWARLNQQRLGLREGDCVRFELAPLCADSTARALGQEAQAVRFIFCFVCFCFYFYFKGFYALACLIYHDYFFIFIFIFIIIINVSIYFIFIIIIIILL